MLPELAHRTFQQLLVLLLYLLDPVLAKSQHEPALKEINSEQKVSGKGLRCPVTASKRLTRLQRNINPITSSQAPRWSRANRENSGGAWFDLHRSVTMKQLFFWMVRSPHVHKSMVPDLCVAGILYSLSLKLRTTSRRQT